MKKFVQLHNESYNSTQLERESLNFYFLVNLHFVRKDKTHRHTFTSQTHSRNFKL